MRVPLIARRPFTFAGRALSIGDAFEASPIESVRLRTRCLAGLAPARVVPVESHNSFMPRCRFCGERADRCGGTCPDAMAARTRKASNPPAAPDADLVFEAPAEPSVDENPAKAKRKYQRRDLRAEE